MKKLIRLINARLYDENRKLDERQFELLTIISVISVLLALIGDIIEGENIIEIVVLCVTVVVVPIITYTAVRFGKVQLAANFVALALVLIVHPVTFYFGGGPFGGGVFWVVFSFLYIGLIINGFSRIIIMIFLSLEITIEYFISYTRPELIYYHDARMTHIDSLISVILVGVVIFTMVWFQNLLFMAENRRAKEETKRAEEAIRSQNQFFSSMSHEIRTPINSIVGLNEIILRSDDASDEIVRDALNIQGAGRMLLALVNDILDISKIEAGKMEIVSVNYDVASLISEVVNMVWLRAEEKGLEFKVDIDPLVPTELFGDEVRIKQILVNLLNNAVKYTREGYISLHIESESKGEESVFLTISVMDTGMGIKQDAIPHLFDAFQRVDEKRNRYIEGTGLGLSIVKQLVELMGGKISVNSVYTQGSTFKVVLPQAVTNKQGIGNINITSYESNRNRVAYEHSFTAPDASVLIVDDNEMNLEVEKKLLLGTGMHIDTARSGSEALIATLENSYDVIMMDHLMPEMDGIECLSRIRRQTGGLNRNTPVLVLTANAGSENQQLYNTSGFDGYLLKPVSGKQLEEMLLNYLSSDKVEILGKENIVKGRISTSSDYKRKIPVIITTGSVCDLPPSVTKFMGLDFIPYLVKTEKGVFWDNMEMDSQEILQYMSFEDRIAISEAPSEKDFEEFFAKEIQKTHHIIHISMGNMINDEYDRAVQAALAFENVTVINSGVLSSSMGLLVMAAHKMAKQDFKIERIIAEIENLKNCVHCSFVVTEPDYLARRGFLSERLGRIISSLNMHPCLTVKNNRFGLGKIFIGNKERYISDYIKYAISQSRNPDGDLLFLTYAGVGSDDIEFIKKEIDKKGLFKNVVVQQASAAITLNCGPGAFGLLFLDKSNLSLELSTLLPVDEKDDFVDLQMMDDTEEDVVSSQDADDNFEDEDSNESEPITIEIPEGFDDSGFDLNLAVEYSGSEKTFKSVLKIFCESIPANYRELCEYYESGNWENYTIKIHALKSSARLVGAIELAEDAYALEMAGTDVDIAFINENHEIVMDEYMQVGERLKEAFLKDDENTQTKGDVMEADPAVIEALYEAIREAAKNMDIDAMEEAFEEIESYSIPESEQKRYLMIKNCYEQFDYDKILVILDNDK